MIFFLERSEYRFMKFILIKNRKNLNQWRGTLNLTLKLSFSFVMGRVNNMTNNMFLSNNFIDTIISNNFIDTII